MRTLRMVWAQYVEDGEPAKTNKSFQPLVKIEEEEGGVEKNEKGAALTQGW